MRLGSSGLKISRITLACMGFGDGSRLPWATLDDERAEPIFRQAVDLGITCWDTFNIYSYGSSEEIVGRAITKYTKRDDVVLATKLNNPRCTTGRVAGACLAGRRWNRSMPR